MNWMADFANLHASQQNADLSRKVRELEGKVRDYERMLQSAYTIEFTDHEMIIDKSGNYESSTGILWSVRHEDRGEYISHHETALEAFAALEDK